MFNRFFTDPLQPGLAQAAAAAVVAYAVVLVARGRQIHLERETPIALVRGLVQTIAVGSVPMIFAASGLTSLVSTQLIRTQAFTDAEQLRLRSGAIAVHSKG